MCFVLILINFDLKKKCQRNLSQNPNILPQITKDPNIPPPGYLIREIYKPLTSCEHLGCSAACLAAGGNTGHGGVTAGPVGGGVGGGLAVGGLTGTAASVWLAKPGGV